MLTFYPPSLPTQRGRGRPTSLAVPALLALLLMGCPGNPTPNPTPTPPPDPTPTAAPPGVHHVEQLLRRDGVRWLTLEGEPFEYRQWIECCGNTADLGYAGGWPVLSKGAVDFAAQNGVTVLHMRPGPFMAQNEDNWDTGPYAADVDGKVNIGVFFEPWWAEQEFLIWYAGTKGIRVEVGLIDWWRVKHGYWGDVPHAWQPENNVQGVDRLTGVGRDGVFNDFATLWLRQVVERFGRFGNVLFFDGTEAALAPYYSERTTARLRQMVRDWEAELSYPVHMFGSNGNRTAQEGDVDYVLEHNYFPRQPVASKPTVWQEYNGTPPLTADLWKLHACEAIEQGTHLALWRGWRPMVASDVLASLSWWKEPNCTFLGGSFPPDSEAPGWGRPFQAAPLTANLLEAAKSKLANPCGKNPVMTLKSVGYLLRRQGYTAGLWADAVAIQNARGEYEEWHAVAFGNGCWVQTPYRNTWPYEELP